LGCFESFPRMAIPHTSQTPLFENAAIAERAASCLVKTAQPGGETRGALYAAAASRDYTV
jgi:hypothetical protein